MTTFNMGYKLLCDGIIHCTDENERSAQAELEPS